jgi:GTPase SAR1 family protein
MEQNKLNYILVIGGPNVGKTHYGGQLYGRLVDRSGMYSITTPPKDLTVFREVLDCLNEGKSAGHTSAGSNTRLELGLEDIEKNKIVFSFPDYGGEQILKIVSDRKINSIWQNDINNCDSWMLFIRLDQINPIEDVINRGLPQADVLKSRVAGQTPFQISEQAFFVDLLQILLTVKGISTHELIITPRLTVVLSCWDLLHNHEKKVKPDQLLRERMPMLHSYLKMSWAKDALEVIGLSSTERSLSTVTGDKDYMKRGPEAFGYLVTKDGRLEKDLTTSIAAAIDRR